MGRHQLKMVCECLHQEFLNKNRNFLLIGTARLKWIQCARYWLVPPVSTEAEFQFGVTKIATVQVRIEFWLHMLSAPFTVCMQGARGIVARFLKWSPASAVSPIMIKFSQYNPPLNLLLSTGVHLPARLKGPRQENQRAVTVKIIRAVWGKMENKKFKKQGIWELQYRA